MKYAAPMPWTVDRESVHSHWTNSVSVTDANGGEVCILTRGYEGDPENDGEGCPSWTNARLIAAAPTMLKALRTIDRAIAGCHGFGSIFDKAREEIRAAIIAAESV